VLEEKNRPAQVSVSSRISGWQRPLAPDQTWGFTQGLLFLKKKKQKDFNSWRVHRRIGLAGPEGDGGE
jgi:hypothetical protein